MSKIHVFERGGWDYAVVDVADNVTTIYTGPCYLKRTHVNTVLSAHALPIKNGTTTVYTLPASQAAGVGTDFWGTFFDTSLIIDPNDAATGNITVVWRAA